jgi:hypothetical protein
VGILSDDTSRDDTGQPDCRLAWNPVTATWEPTGLSSPRLPAVPGSVPGRAVKPRKPSRPCQGHGANTLRALPGRVSRARARGRSGVRAGSTRDREAQAVSGLTRRQRRQARAIAHRLLRGREGA